jgi:anti-anti-sigma factor
MAALRVSASAGADGPVVVLSGEADPTTAAVLREMLAAQLDTGARLVTVDASGLSFLDSASVRVLVLAARALTPVPQELITTIEARFRTTDVSLPDA